MKKFFAFAIMALLVGGLAFSASAQNKVSTKKNVKQEVKQTQQVKKDVKGEDWDKVIKEYEMAVENCVTLYQKMQKNDGTGKDLSKEFNTAVNKAENLKKKIEAAKDGLTRKPTLLSCAIFLCQIRSSVGSSVVPI